MTKAITENPEVHRRSTTKNIHKCISKTFVLLGAKLPPQQNLDSAQLFWMLRLFFCLLGVLLLQHFRATIFLKINILPFFIWSWNVIYYYLSKMKSLQLCKITYMILMHFLLICLPELNWKKICTRVKQTD